MKQTRPPQQQGDRVSSPRKRGSAPIPFCVRLGAGFLALSLALPPSAYALKPVETQEGAGLEELTRTLKKSASDLGLPVPTTRGRPPAGLEEEERQAVVTELNAVREATQRILGWIPESRRGSPQVGVTGRFAQSLDRLNEDIRLLEEGAFPSGNPERDEGPWDQALRMIVQQGQTPRAGAEEVLRAKGVSMEMWEFLKGFSPAPKGVWEPLDTSETTRLILEAMERLKPFFEGRSVLDTGTGTGILALAALVNLRASYAVATDIASHPLDTARRHARRLTISVSSPELAAAGKSGRLEFHRGDLLDPVKNRRFDVAVFNAPDPLRAEAYVRGVGEVLKPDGFALLMWHRNSNSDLRALASQHGLFLDSLLQNSLGWRIYAISPNEKLLQELRQRISLPLSSPTAGLEGGSVVPRLSEGQLLDGMGKVSPDSFYGWVAGLPAKEQAEVARTLSRAYRSFGQHMRWVARMLPRERRQARVSLKEDRTVVTDKDIRIQRVFNHLVRRRFPKMAVIGEEASVDVVDTPWRVIRDPIDGTNAYRRKPGEQDSQLYLSTLTLLYETYPVLTIAVAPEYQLPGEQAPGLWLVAGLGIDGVLVNGRRVPRFSDRSLGKLIGGVNDYRHTRPYNPHYRQVLERHARGLAFSPLSIAMFELIASELFLKLPGIYLTGPEPLWDALPPWHLTLAAGGEVLTLEGTPFRLTDQLLSRESEALVPARVQSVSRQAAEELLRHVQFLLQRERTSTAAFPLEPTSGLEEDESLRELEASLGYVDLPRRPSPLRAYPRVVLNAQEGMRALWELLPEEAKSLEERPEERMRRLMNGKNPKYPFNESSYIWVRRRGRGIVFRPRSRGIATPWRRFSLRDEDFLLVSRELSVSLIRLPKDPKLARRWRKVREGAFEVTSRELLSASDAPAKGALGSQLNFVSADFYPPRSVKMGPRAARELLLRVFPSSGAHFLSMPGPRRLPMGRWEPNLFTGRMVVQRRGRRIVRLKRGEAPQDLLKDLGYLVVSPHRRISVVQIPRKGEAGGIILGYLKRLPEVDDRGKRLTKKAQPARTQAGKGPSQTPAGATQPKFKEGDRILFPDTREIRQVERIIPGSKGEGPRVSTQKVDPATGMPMGDKAAFSLSALDQRGAYLLSPPSAAGLEEGEERFVELLRRVQGAGELSKRMKAARSIAKIPLNDLLQLRQAKQAVLVLLNAIARREPEAELPLQADGKAARVLQWIKNLRNRRRINELHRIFYALGAQEDRLLATEPTAGLEELPEETKEAARIISSAKEYSPAKVRNAISQLELWSYREHWGAKEQLPFYELLRPIFLDRSLGPSVRKEVAGLLGMTGLPEALGPFSIVLGVPDPSGRDPSPAVRDTVLLELSFLVYETEEQMDRAIQLLEGAARQDPHKEVRETARESLEELRSVFRLAKRLWNQKAEVADRQGALRTLVSYVVPDPDDVREHFLWILWRALERETDAEQAIRLIRPLVAWAEDVQLLPYKETPSPYEKEVEALRNLLQSIPSRFFHLPPEDEVRQRLEKSVDHGLARLAPSLPPSETSGLEEGLESKRDLRWKRTHSKILEHLDSLQGGFVARSRFAKEIRIGGETLMRHGFHQMVAENNKTRAAERPPRRLIFLGLDEGMAAAVEEHPGGSTTKEEFLQYLAEWLSIDWEDPIRFFSKTDWRVPLVEQNQRRVTQTFKPLIRLTRPEVDWIDADFFAQPAQTNQVVLVSPSLFQGRVGPLVERAIDALLQIRPFQDRLIKLSLAASPEDQWGQADRVASQLKREKGILYQREPGYRGRSTWGESSLIGQLKSKVRVLRATLEDRIVPGGDPSRLVQKILLDLGVSEEKATLANVQKFLESFSAGLEERIRQEREFSPNAEKELYPKTAIQDLLRQIKEVVRVEFQFQAKTSKGGWSRALPLTSKRLPHQVSSPGLPSKDRTVRLIAITQDPRVTPEDLNAFLELMQRILQSRDSAGPWLEFERFNQWIRSDATTVLNRIRSRGTGLEETLKEFKNRHAATSQYAEKALKARFPGDAIWATWSGLLGILLRAKNFPYERVELRSLFNPDLELLWRSLELHYEQKMGAGEVEEVEAWPGAKAAIEIRQMARRGQENPEILSSVRWKDLFGFLLYWEEVESMAWEGREEIAYAVKVSLTVPEEGAKQVVVLLPKADSLFQKVSVTESKLPIQTQLEESLYLLGSPDTYSGGIAYSHLQAGRIAYHARLAEEERRAAHEQMQASRDPLAYLKSELIYSNEDDDPHLNRLRFVRRRLFNHPDLLGKFRGRTLTVPERKELQELQANVIQLLLRHDVPEQTVRNVWARTMEMAHSAAFLNVQEVGTVMDEAAFFLGRYGNRYQDSREPDLEITRAVLARIDKNESLSSRFGQAVLFIIQQLRSGRQDLEALRQEVWQRFSKSATGPSERLETGLEELGVRYITDTGSGVSGVMEVAALGARIRAAGREEVRFAAVATEEELKAALAGLEDPVAREILAARTFTYEAGLKGSHTFALQMAHELVPNPQQVIIELTQATVSWFQLVAERLGVEELYQIFRDRVKELIQAA